MNVMPNLNRRSFLVGSSTAGLVLGFHVPFEAAAEPASPQLSTPQLSTPEVNAWVVVKPDETVVIRVARSEMGQGTLTGLCQLVAEELDCDWSKVSYEFPTPGENLARKRVWSDFFTAGSRGIRASNEYVRKGGAAAREMLIQAAAKEWNVPAAECKADAGVITHAKSNRSTTFGKVASAAAKIEPPADVKLKDPKDWKIAGKGVKRLDTPLKVDGRAIYGIDVKLPGMVSAAIKASPAFGGTVKSFDASKVASMKGVKKVAKIGDNAVAVIADTWWNARTALDALPITWDEGPNANVSSATIAEMLRAGLDADQAIVGNQGGDVKAALAGAAKKVEAVYAYPYQHHVTLEPQNATVLYTPEKCEVWSSVQDGEQALAATAEAAGIPVTKCEVYKTFLGGGFGRRATSVDYVRQAVLVAKEMPGTPVKLLWTREEDMTHGWYHPITQCKMSAGFDDKKNLNALHIRISGQSILATVAPGRMQNGMDPATFAGFYKGGAEAAFGYDVPNLLIDHAMRNPPIPPGFWRGVNINHNAIYIESFMDELAKEMGVDPLEFRRKLMANNPKHLAVLNAVAEKAGWGKPAPQGVYRGLAQMMAFDSYVAAAAEISVTDGNKIKVHRIVASTDPGYAVNPAQIERQVAGSFVYGLSALYYQECTVKDGRIVETNFDTYDSMRIAQMPKVESIIIQSGGSGPWGGIGEPTICVA
ncbi:MAG: xanthine dehydrogenase family protein molybdopterin-binding subunit, partial [Xanthobacteraceae bacterium]|nr:xanthine dehydrogenase family protein molybdopterin-binding subunit [Xanthobacteraceae bacterium]